MRTAERLVLFATLSLGLCACATSSIKLAPPAANIPWTPATRADGEIIAGEAAKPNALRSEGYVLPANPTAAGTPPAGSQPDTAHSYTLAELIDLAESRNPTTRMAWESARNAALATGIAKAAYLPNLSASVVGAYQSGHHDLTLAGAHSGNDSSLHGSISALSVQWLLFDFGERDALIGVAGEVSTIANIAFTAAHQQVIYQVSFAYYTHVAAVARVATAEKALENAGSIEAAAEARHAQGVGTVLEVAQAHQITAQARLADVQARGQSDNTHMSLMAAIGLSPLIHFKLADIGHRRLTSAMRAPIESVVSDALARRPDVLSAYAAHRASLSKLKAAKAEFLPKLFLSATGSYSSTGFDVTALPGFGQQPPTINVAGSNWGGTILLGVTVPLYDGGVRRALEAQARADEARSDAALERVREEATREVVGTGNNLKTSLAALEASEALASASQITFDGALDAYRQGIGSITEVTRTETVLLEAQNASTDAYSAALIAAATLALAVGTLGNSPE